MPQHITVVNYDPEWSSKYVRERDYITEILKENCISIYHIGSTSVPGLAATPSRTRAKNALAPQKPQLTKGPKPKPTNPALAPKKPFLT